MKLACLTVRDKGTEEVVSPEDKEFKILDTRFLETPALAIEQSRNAARNMAQEAKQALRIALTLIDDYSEEKALQVQKIESKVDRYEDELGTYLVNLNHKNLTLEDSQSLSIMLHCIGDFERISDHAVEIKDAAEEMHQKKLHFSQKALAELHVLEKAVNDIVEMAYQAFAQRNMGLAAAVEPLEEVVDELCRELKNRHVDRLRAGECTIEMGFILSDINTGLERVADHCSNIGVCVTQVRENLFDTHSHLDMIKNSPDEKFYREVETDRSKYVLP